MALTYSQRLALANSHKSLVRGSGLGTSLEAATDTFLVIGQSNALANLANSDSVVTPTTGTVFGTMRGAYGDYNIKPVVSGASKPPFFGPSNISAPFGKTWHDLTGRRSLWINIPVAGTNLVSTGSGNQWAVTPAPTSLIGAAEVETGYTQATLIERGFLTKAIHPRLGSGLRIAVWCQGENDADRVNAMQLTGETYQAALDEMFTALKSAWSIDYFLIYVTGREGADAGTIATNEPGRIIIRAAQVAVADARADTFVILNTAKELGVPLDTLVETNGVWTSGWAYSDGQHYTSRAYYTMGVTGARNASRLLGFTGLDLNGV